jgi:hypothetical protein
VCALFAPSPRSSLDVNLCAFFVPSHSPHALLQPQTHHLRPTHTHHTSAAPSVCFLHFTIQSQAVLPLPVSCRQPLPPPTLISLIHQQPSQSITTFAVPSFPSHASVRLNLNQGKVYKADACITAKSLLREKNGNGSMRDWVGVGAVGAWTVAGWWAWCGWRLHMRPMTMTEVRYEQRIRNGSQWLCLLCFMPMPAQSCVPGC